MLTSNVQAPGSPGIEPRWTSGAKTGVGTALSNKSRVWFTLSHGIFTEKSIHGPYESTANRGLEPSGQLFAIVGEKE